MKKRRSSFGWGLAVALSLVTGSFLHAQESRGTILGRVTDESNAVIPGVTVEAFNVETGVTVTASTNSQGNYQIPFLNAGTYRVSFGLTGFNKLVRDGVTLRVADLLTVNASLKVGGLTEEVVVRAKSRRSTAPRRRWARSST